VTFYYICDKCGDLAHITYEPVEDDERWACDKCGSLALWEFENFRSALQHQSDIMQRNRSRLFRTS
jgi:DNA-directed RNA polymerase subunit RPC12/RpoP